MDDIHFERVHRMTTRQDRVNSKKPRGVIVNFSFYQDKKYVWSFVRTLKDSGIGIPNDFPREIDKILEKTLSGFKIGKESKTERLLQSKQAYYQRASFQR